MGNQQSRSRRGGQGKQQQQSGQGKQQPQSGQGQQHQGGQGKPQPQSGQGQQHQGGQNVYGEGNYAGTRQYDDATKRYVESGRVEEAARAAAPKTNAEAREMDAAEAEGKRRAKGEDPALDRPASPDVPRPGHEEE